MNKAKLSLVSTMCLLAVAFGCNQHPRENKTTHPGTLTTTGSIRELVLYPDPPPDFPDHDGKTEFVSYCAICHSLKYISMQPNFPEKTWTAEVAKMITKYHAPIDSLTGKKIVAYLTAIKGA